MKVFRQPVENVDEARAFIVNVPEQLALGGGVPPVVEPLTLYSAALCATDESPACRGLGSSIARSLEATGVECLEELAGQPRSLGRMNLDTN
jgi:hypothetical protein